MSDSETRLVSTTLPLEIDGKVRPAGTELTLPATDAQVMVDAGRALWCGEPLKGLTDEERAALPRLEALPADGPAEMVTGLGPIGSAPSAPATSSEEDAPIIASAPTSPDPAQQPADPAPQPQEA